MAKFLFAWELGGHLGHLARLAPLAKALDKCGHQVFLVVRELHLVRKVFGDTSPFIFFQAPITRRSITSSRRPLTYAEIMQCNGYSDWQELLYLVRAWQSLFQLVDPDFLLMDYAPTAMLAGRSFECPKIEIGSGFFMHPLTSPSPVLLPDTELSVEQRQQSDDAVIRVINRVLELEGIPQLNCIRELFVDYEQWLVTYAELDHLSDYRDPKPLYHGLIQGNAKENSVRLYNSSQKWNVFAYLKAECPMLDPTITALQQLPVCAHVYLAGADKALLARYSAKNVCLSNNPIDLNAAATQSDLVICHGGHDTVAQTLLRGRPLLILPHQQEQLITAQCVKNMKAGLIQRVNKKINSQMICEKIITLLTDERYSASAKIFSNKYRDYSPNEQCDNLANYCQMQLA